MPPTFTLAAFLAERYDTVHGVEQYDRPMSAIRALSELRRKSNTTRRPSLGVDLRDSSTRGHWSRKSMISWSSEDLTARGFDPEHVTIEVTISPDDWSDGVLEQTLGAGFTVYGRDGRVRSSREYVKGWSDRDDALRHRPDPWATLLDYSDPRERSNYIWISLSRSEGDTEAGGRPKGMARGPWACYRQRELRRITRTWVEHCKGLLSETIVMHNVDVKVYWRGEEIGQASLGGVEIGGSYLGGSDAQVEDVLLGNDMIDEALSDAETWADNAVKAAQEQAAAMIESIALLPERSLALVRSSLAPALPLRKRA